MRPTNFEVCHPLWLHQALVTAAFLTYLADPEDIVWRFIKNSSHVRLRERLIFAAATLLFGVSALVCTRSRGAVQKRSNRQTSYVAEFLYAIALGTLFPLAGFILLAAGEGIRLLRLSLSNDAPSQPIALPPAVRKESLKWGLLLTMIVFTITLQDRLAEILVALTGLVWIILNARHAFQRPGLDPPDPDPPDPDPPDPD